MYLNEEQIHYILYFLNRYDIETKTHKDAVQQLRQISDALLEKLYKPATINVIRKPKPEPDKKTSI